MIAEAAMMTTITARVAGATKGPTGAVEARSKGGSPEPPFLFGEITSPTEPFECEVIDSKNEPCLGEKSRISLFGTML
jgi:hypothetical protein